MGKALLINPVSGEQYLLESSVVMGCDGACNLPFADWDLAPVHASINKVGDQWHLSDLGAASGVYLDYQRLPSMGTVRLTEGSSIRMGNTELYFTEDPVEIRRYEQAMASAAVQQPAAQPVQTGEGERPTTTAEDALRAAEKTPVGPAVAPPPPGREKPAKTGSKGLSKKKLVIALSSVAAVIVLLFGWCLLFHLQGNSRMASGDYPAAVSAYGKDFLFSGSGYREAARLAGEQAFEARDYVTAAAYFQRLGAEGEPRRIDSMVERGKQLIEEGDPQAAIDYLQQIAQEERAAEQIDVAKLAIAWQYVDAQNYEDAIATAEQITHTAAADPTAVQDTCYRGLAERAISQGEYEKARDYYDMCRHDTAAAANASILRALLDGDACGAAQLADNYLTTGWTDLSREQWQGILEAVIGSELPTDLEGSLRREAANALLAERVDFGSDAFQTALGARMGTSSMVGQYSTANESVFPVPSLEELTGRCGSRPQGKILIVCVRHDFPNKEETCAIRFDLMELLPKERYPLSLDEVEYLVVITYDCTKYATYHSGTSALRETGRITVTRLPGNQRIVNGNTLQGDYAPTTVTYSGTAPVWRSGGAPDMAQELYQALKKTIEQQ